MKLKVLAIVVLGAVGLAAIFIAMGGLPASSASTTKYLTSAAATGDVTSSVAATGSLATTASFGLAFGTSPHLAGTSGAGGSTTWTVTQLDAKVGDAVKAGTVLAVADTADLKRQLNDATTALRVARIQLADAQTTYDAASGTTAIHQAQIGLYNAQTQVSNAQNARQTLQDEIGNATLKSPIDGVVTAVNITKGLVAPSGDAIVVDASDLQVTADVVESDVALMAVGQPADVTISAVGAALTGSVAAIAPNATSASSGGSVVSFPVTISIKGAPATVRPGMTANITITIDSATGVLTVPSAALRGTTGSYTVLVMDANGQPVSTPVEVGLVTNTTSEVKGGLTAGQVVVTGIDTPQTSTATGGGLGGGGLGGGFGGGFGGGTGRPRNGN